MGGLVPSWLAALESKESAARSRAGELREQIAGLSEALTLVETELSRLQITRETMTEVLADGPGPTAPGPDAELAVVPLTELVPVLLAAEAAGDATVTSEAYRRILVVFAQAPGPLRAGGSARLADAGGDPVAVPGPPQGDPAGKVLAVTEIKELWLAATQNAYDPIPGTCLLAQALACRPDEEVYVRRGVLRFLSGGQTGSFLKSGGQTSRSEDAAQCGGHLFVGVQVLQGRSFVDLEADRVVSLVGPGS
ncbi:hypothetical protein [Streptomyces sp. NPDC014734]|uniref:hypothetical protein n=1 Tax=Streptomyces sp. NPDC014734 TaxID=3364886 RepID=UPI00370135A6